MSFEDLPEKLEENDNQNHQDKHFIGEKMKAFLKNLSGAFKKALVAYPIVLVAGGIAGVAGLMADGFIKQEKVYDEVRNTEFVQELIESEKENLDVPFEESGMSLEEWSSRKKYLESDDFIEDILKNSTELKEYSDKKDAASNEIMCSLVFALPLAMGFASLFTFYTALLEDDFTSPSEKLLASADEDFAQAKEIKELSRKKKEYDEYKEEICNN